MLFAHESNILSKIKKNYKGNKIFFEKFYENEYLPVKVKLLDIDFTKGLNSFIEASKIFEEYLNKLNEFSEQYSVDAHSKFRSSFLEEISAYLFKDNEYIKNDILGIYNRGIYTGIKIDANMDVSVLTKDVDFCIGKKCELRIDDKIIGQIIIPIVAVEVKTYLDSTMFGEAQHSSRLIKNASPSAKAYVLMETNEVGIDNILAARSDCIIDEMFVLRISKSDCITPEVLMDYYEEIESIINAIDKQNIVSVPGRLLNVE